MPIIGKSCDANDTNILKPDSCFVITNKCNWDCEYCIVDTHNRIEKERDDVIKIVHKIPANTTCSLSGGEPGTVDKELLNYSFDELEKKNCDICINTNGLFLKRHPEFYNRVKDYFYHCSENLEIGDIEFFDDPDVKIIYMIVVTDNNFPNFDKFINHYSDIEFHVHAAQRGAIQKKGNYLSKMNALKIATKYKDVINTEHIKYLLFKYSELNPVNPITLDSPDA